MLYAVNVIHYDSQLLILRQRYEISAVNANLKLLNLIPLNMIWDVFEDDKIKVINIRCNARCTSNDKTKFLKSCLHSIMKTGFVCS